MRNLIMVLALILVSAAGCGSTAPRVEIEITGTGVNVRGEVTPSYVSSQPNGPDCPPTCTQARVRIDV